jgi:glycosyltransferase involved in cell wall biosynthesis
VAACDVILCTSESEGWPNAVKEALACNVPFVATDVSDLAQIAEREPACRIAPAEPAALADALCAVLTGPPPADLRRHVLEMGLEATTDRLIGFYDWLLARSSRTQPAAVDPAGIV